MNGQNTSRLETGEIQGLGVNVAVDGKEGDSAELLDIDVLRGEDGFEQVRAGARVVVLRRGNHRQVWLRGGTGSLRRRDSGEAAHEQRKEHTKFQAFETTTAADLFSP